MWWKVLSVISLVNPAFALHDHHAQWVLAGYDPCAEIARKTRVLPREVRACLSAFPVDPVVKANVNLKADLARIDQTRYASEFDLHLDFYRAFKRVNDDHCGVYNYCYDGLYVTYLPLPLVLLTDKDGYQNVYIVPRQFKDEIEFWQNALPEHLRGQLNTLSGARVYLIDGEEPFIETVNKSALMTGANDWSYLMGNFAAIAHPLVDSVELTVQRIPYRSRFGSSSKNFTDLASYRENNCVAQNTTNGVDLYGPDALSQNETIPNPIAHFQQQPGTNPLDARKQRVNVILDAIPLSDIELPRELQPSLAPLNQSYSLTCVLALGCFSAANFTKFGSSLLDGLTSLKELGPKISLLTLYTNNGGGYICIAHWLHRIIVKPRNTTVPQAGLDTTLRAGPLAKLLVEKWRNAAHVTFPANSEWLNPQDMLINGRTDAFSQRIGQECQPFDWQPPNDTLFEPHNIVIISMAGASFKNSVSSLVQRSRWRRKMALEQLLSGSFLDVMMERILRSALSCAGIRPPF
ncbi:hypothetical protein JOM56_002174 [Amanita muscaria]